MADQLNDAEKAYFETGGETDLPAGYGDDVKAVISPSAVEDDKNKAPPEGDGGATDDAAQAADAAAAPDADESAMGKVPYGALKEEREARKRADQQVRELNDKFALANERMAMIMQAKEAQALQAAKPAVEEQKIPNFDEDPIAAGKWMQEKILADEQTRQRQQQEYQQRTQQQTQQAQYQNNVIGAYVQSANEARTAEPKFDEAHGWLMQNRYDELVAGGMNDQTARQQVIADEFALAAGALEARQSPAQRLLAVAKARGWKPTGQAANQESSAAAQQLETVARGQAANGSLGSAGTAGNARPGKVDAKALSEMSDKEWKAWYAKNGADGFRDVMGG